MIERQTAPGRSERGASLVMALVFLAAIGPLLAALVSLSGNNLLNTSNLNSQRNTEFAGDTLVDGAVQAIRHQAQTVPVLCSAYPSPTGTMVNGVTLVAEWCSGIPAGLYGRSVEFDACLASAGSWSNCQRTAVARPTVLFDDVGSGCTSGSNPGCYESPADWGTAMTIESWNVRTANG